VASAASALAGLATIMIVLAIGSAVCGVALLALSMLSRVRKRSSLRAVSRSGGSSSQAEHDTQLSLVSTPEDAEVEDRLSANQPSDDEGAYEPAQDIPGARGDSEESRELEPIGSVLQTLRALREELEGSRSKALDPHAVRTNLPTRELAAEVELLAQLIRVRTMPASPSDTPSSEATAPPSVQLVPERLSISEDLESESFRPRGRHARRSSSEPKASVPPPMPVAAAPAGAAGSDWSAPADEGWRAAQVVAQPAAGETTSAGLPKRVPGANLVPGSISGESATQEPLRSADAARHRMASFQRGVKEARAAIGSSGESPPEEDEGSQEAAAAGSDTGGVRNPV
jgi:hypothetical protein